MFDLPVTDYKLKYTTMYMYFRLMAAIFDLSVTSASESIHTCLTVLLDLKKGLLS